MRNKEQIIFEDTNKMVEAISFQKEAYDSSKHENITHIGHWFNFNIAMTGRYYEMFMEEYVGQKVRFLIIQIVAMFFLMALASFHYFTGALSSANSLTLLVIIVFAYLLSCSVSMVKHIDSMTTMTKELVFNTFLLHDAVFQRVDTRNALTDDLTRYNVSRDTNISQEDARNLALDSIDDRRLALDYLDAAINLLITKHKINEILTTFLFANMAEFISYLSNQPNCNTECEANAERVSKHISYSKAKQFMAIYKVKNDESSIG